MRFIHTVDVHIDSPLVGLRGYQDAPAEQRRNATRDAFTELVTIAIAEQVDFMVIAGGSQLGAGNSGVVNAQERSERLLRNLQSNRPRLRTRVLPPVFAACGQHASTTLGLRCPLAMR